MTWEPIGSLFFINNNTFIPFGTEVRIGLKERILTFKTKEDVMAYYRGVNYTPQEATKTTTAKSGVYRGVKWVSVDQEKSPKRQSGIYRGVKWAA